MNRTVCYHQTKPSQSSPSLHSTILTHEHNQDSEQSECNCCCCLSFQFFAFRYKNTLKINMGQDILGQEFNMKGRESSDIRPLGEIMQFSPWNGNRQHEKNKWNSDMPQIEQLSQQSYPQNSQDCLIDNPNKESIPASQQTIIKHTINYQQFQDSHGHKIVKMNNLGDQSENNSSPNQEMRDQGKQNSRNFDKYIQGDELEANQEEKENKNSHRHKEDDNQIQILVQFAERVEQNYMSSPLEWSNDQQIPPKNDCTMPRINEQRQFIKQEEKRVKEQHSQSNQHLQSISSNRLPPTKPKNQNQHKVEPQNQVKRQILQQLRSQHIDTTHYPISNIQQLTNPNEYYRPYSQPQYPHEYFNSQHNEQIYSQHQGFQYDHQELQAQKSRYSRYSKKLDQQLKHQQRRQYTDLQVPKLQKLQYNLQENRHSIEQSLHSEPKSMPAEVKGQMLKQQHSHSQEQWRLRQQNWLKVKEMENAMDLAFPADLHSDQHYNYHTEEEIKSEHKEKEQGNFYSKEEEAGISPLVSEGEVSDSQSENPPKKLQEDQSAYAMISLSESVKLEMQPFHVAKQEENRQTVLSQEKVNYQGRVEQNVKEEQAGSFYDDSQEESEEQKIKGLSLQKIQNLAVYQPEFVQNPLPEPFEQSSSGYHRQEENSDISEQSSKLPSSKRFQNEIYCQQQISESEEEQNNSQQKVKHGMKISKREALKQKKQLKAQLEQRPVYIKVEERKQNLDIFHTLQIIIQPSQAQQNQQPNFKLHKSNITINSQYSLKEEGKGHLTHHSNHHFNHQLSHSNNQYPAYHRLSNRKHKHQSRTKYVREEDYDPSKYEAVDEVIYKRTKPKRRIIEEIYDPVQKKIGNTKRLARQYAYRHRDNIKTLDSPQRQVEQFGQLYVEELVEDDRQIYSSIRPRSYRKSHKHAMNRRKQRNIQTVRLISDSELERNQHKSPHSANNQ